VRTRFGEPSPDAFAFNAIPRVTMFRRACSHAPCEQPSLLDRSAARQFLPPDRATAPTDSRTSQLHDRRRRLELGAIR
jgi:hypothetical protein